MRRREVLLGAYRRREAAALLVDGQLDDLLVAPGDDRPVPGAIYRAVAGRPAKGQGGLFLRLPDGSAFLRQTRGIAPGQRLLVQVTGHAEPGKAVPVTTRVLFKSRLVIVTPDAPGVNVSRGIADEERRVALREAIDGIALPEGAGLIVRSAAEDADNADVTADAAEVSELARAILYDTAGEPELLLDGPGPHDLALRDWGSADDLIEGADTFAARGLTEMIDALLLPEVALPGGGRMTIEPTRALVAVDVDTGSDTSPAAGLKANIDAARALPRQLRCRGLGGQITVDFAPMPKRDRIRLEQALGAALRADAVETSVAGWTPLSHMELQRKRERIPLREAVGG
ncbi:ribonuclease E/G [Roseitranquillus sediminis]|uniref:ribonuclease E/G n=1 Tax=Roseitranquillus sediminis TaxID=2809051 RepID=UPI001D0C5918|nr:ribonuclease E/G [Roseitranquillus sediminis]MBM9594232.1 ribonuclease E/G [Roseitranquillus sediminis]